MFKPSGYGKSHIVDFDRLTIMSAHRYVGCLVDKKCEDCGSQLRVQKGPKVVFLGCSNFPGCSASPVFPWKPYGLAREEGEKVFYIDDLGEPIDPPSS